MGYRRSGTQGCAGDETGASRERPDSHRPHRVQSTTLSNGKVERSHRTDQEEFYPLLDYVDDVDLNKKVAEWERFYNLTRAHGAFGGQTPYDALRERLQ